MQIIAAVPVEIIVRREWVADVCGEAEFVAVGRARSVPAEPKNAVLVGIDDANAMPAGVPVSVMHMVRMVGRFVMAVGRAIGLGGWRGKRERRRRRQDADELPH